MALALQGAIVTGIDNSEIALNIANDKSKKLKLSNCSFINVDVSSFSDDHFDFVLMNDVTEHLSDRELDVIFTQIRRILKYMGQVVIHTPNGLNLILKTDKSIFHSLYEIYRKVRGREHFHLSPVELYQMQVHINVKSYRQLRKFLQRYGITKTKVIYDISHKISFLTKFYSADMLVIGYLYEK